jgi:hypothetical protein
LYTRPIGSKFDPEGPCATYSPDTENKFSIVTERPRANSKNANDIFFQQLLSTGCWAAGTLSIHGTQTIFGCESLAQDHNNLSRLATPVRMAMVEIGNKNPDKNPFAGCILKDTGSTIAFGMNVMDSVEGDGGRNNAYSGFHFAYMQVACYNRKTEELERRILVGVKLPKPDEENVSSAFILKQQFSSLRDLRILDGDPRVRDQAAWFKYAIRNKYRERTPIPGWTPRNPEGLGIGHRFNACMLEGHLLCSGDPIRELSNLSAWLEQFTVTDAYTREDMVIHEAFLYMESRLRVMRGELRLREEAGRPQTLVPAWQTMETRQTMETETRQSTRRGLEEGSRSMGRRGRPLVDRTNRRLGDGLSLSLPIIEKRRGRQSSLEL